VSQLFMRSARLSAQQRRIMRLLARSGAMEIAALVQKCFGKVSYGRNPNTRKHGLAARYRPEEFKEHREYMCAYASVSRSLRRLEQAGLITVSNWRSPTKDDNPDNIYPAHAAGVYEINGMPFCAMPERVYVKKYARLNASHSEQHLTCSQRTFCSP